MSQPLHLTQVVLGLMVTVPDEVIELNLGYLPWVLGDSLAGQVQQHVTAERVGYYPAYAYFRDPATGVDQALLALMDEVAQFSVDYARRELRRRLSRVFSSIHVEQAQCTAYTLPRIRPGQPQSLADLGKHFAPSRVKLELVLGSIDKLRLPDPEQVAIDKVQHWAHEPFACLEVLGAHLVTPRRDETG